MALALPLPLLSQQPSPPNAGVKGADFVVVIVSAARRFPVNPGASSFSFSLLPLPLASKLAQLRPSVHFAAVAVDIGAAAGVARRRMRFKRRSAALARLGLRSGGGQSRQAQVDGHLASNKVEEQAVLGGVLKRQREARRQEQHVNDKRRTQRLVGDAEELGAAGPPGAHSGFDFGAGHGDNCWKMSVSIWSVASPATMGSRRMLRAKKRRQHPT